MIEDSPTDAELIQRELRRWGKPCEVERVDDEPALRAVLAHGGWDIVLSDWSLPRFSGSRALGVVRELAVDLPFIIVSGTVGEEVAVAAMRAGAADYVVKDKLGRLTPAIERELRERDERRAHRAIEQQLQLQDLRFRALLQHSSDVITLKSATLELVYVSQAVTALLGYQPSELVGCDALEFVHPEDRAQVRTMTERLIASGGESFVIQYRAFHRNGSERWLEATETNRLADPAVAGLIGNVRDITERKRAQDVLAASELKYRRILETTSEGVWVLDRNGKTTFANGRMASITGYAMAELLGRSAFDLIDDRQRAELGQQLFERHAGIQGMAACMLRCKDGSLRQVMMESTSLLSDTGESEGVLAMITDISARRAAEEELRLSDTRFSRFVESGIVGVCLAGLDGRIHDVNSAYARLTGYTRAELLEGTVTWTAMAAPAHVERQEAELAQLAARGTVEPWEMEIVRKDGAGVPVLIGGALLDQHSCIMFLADLSAQKRAEAALQASEQQLRQAQKMEAVGRLAGGVAHDFNNVLSVILSYSEMMLEDLEPGRVLDDVGEIHRAAMRAGELTRQLLMFSRQQLVKPTVVVVDDTLSEMDRMLRRLLGEDVDFATVGDRQHGRVMIDRGQLEQVIMNLVINARDAMPRGGKLTVETRNTLLDEGYARNHHDVAPGPYVMIAVTDSGFGMDQATVAQIFEPFFTTKPQGQGTGLGLSTVFGIVQSAGGSVWVYSEPGVGTTFKIYLPQIDVVDQAADRPTDPRSWRGTETILLVEDEAPVRAVAESILRRLGYRVLLARDPEDAIRLASQRDTPIDLLLSDVVMPGMGGPELARSIALLRPGLAVLHMSGYTDDSVVRHGMIEGSVAYLQKPLTPDTLGRRVREVLDARRDR